MGKTVEVDLDDLRTIVFSTGIVKSIEAVLQSAVADELAKMVKGNLTAAHDRLASAMRAAERRETMPRLFQPASKAQLEELETLFVYPESFHSPNEDDGIDDSRINLGAIQITRGWWAGPIEANPGDTNVIANYRHLVSAGLCEFGHVKILTLWQSSGDRIVKDSLHIFLRLTTHGFRELKGHLDAKERAKALDELAALGQEIEARQPSDGAGTGEAPDRLRLGDEGVGGEEAQGRAQETITEGTRGVQGAG